MHLSPVQAKGAAGSYSKRKGEIEALAMLVRCLDGVQVHITWPALHILLTAESSLVVEKPMPKEEYMKTVSICST